MYKIIFWILFYFVFILNTQANLFIREVLPNTVDDKKLEYFELYNSWSTNLNLFNYKIIDKSWKEYIFWTWIILESHIGKKFYREETGIALNNTNEKLYLYDNNWNLLDLFKYKKSVKWEYILRDDLESNNDDINKIPYSTIKRRIDEIRYNKSIDKDYYEKLRNKNLANIKNKTINDVLDKNEDISGFEWYYKYIFLILLVIIWFMMLFIILRKDRVI